MQTSAFSRSAAFGFCATALYLQFLPADFYGISLSFYGCVLLPQCFYIMYICIYANIFTRALTTRHTTIGFVCRHSKFLKDVAPWCGNLFPFNNASTLDATPPQWQPKKIYAAQSRISILSVVFFHLTRIVNKHHRASSIT